MSWAALIGRNLWLTARNSDLQYEVSLLSNQLMQLQNAAGQLVPLGTNLQPNSPEAQLLQVKQAQLSQTGKGIEIQLDLKKAEQRAVVTEREANDKMIQEEVKTFKIFANA